MKGIRKHSKLLSAGLASTMLFATTAMAFDTRDSRVGDENSTGQLEEIYFSDEDCSTCKFITVYDQDNKLLYDGLVEDIGCIEDEELNRLLEKSDYIMSNEITDFYIHSQ